MELSFSLILNMILVIGGLIALFSGLYTVEQQEEAIVERFGRFVRTSKPGLNFKLPLVESVYKKDMRVEQLDVEVETKTKDNVFVKMKVSVQYQVKDIFNASYKLTNSKAQIASYVFDSVRNMVPKLTLDETFLQKEEVATHIKSTLKQSMEDFGYGIVNALVTDVDPDSKVKGAMNEINAQTRLRDAATQKAEAEKIIVVKNAEAEMESKILQGKGIAGERAAIIEGLKVSIKDMEEATGSTAGEVMALILMTNYFDTLKSLGEYGPTTILLPHQPGAIGDIQTQLITALQAAPKKPVKELVNGNA